MPSPPVAPLFVPSHMTRLREKALALGLKTVLLDLEDAVPPEQKAAARDGAAGFLKQRPGYDLVRINPLAVSRSFGVACGGEDLAAVVAARPLGIVAPKIETASGLRNVEALMADLERQAGLDPGRTELWVTVETALGVMNLAAIAGARVERPVRLLFGMGDYTTDLGIEWTRDEGECAVPRALVPIAARAAGLPRPVDSVFVATDDEEGLRASALRGKRLGYAGKAAIHPRQVAVIQDAYRPTAAECQWARRTVEAAGEHGQAGIGAFLLDGRMVDEPIVANARDVLERAAGFEGTA